MIHRRNHRNYNITVGKGQNGYLRSLQKLLDDDLVTGMAELLLFHNGFDSGQCLLSCHGNDDALSEGQSVGFDDRRDLAGFYVLFRFFCIGEDFIFSGRNMIFLHEIFGKDLGALQDSRFGIWTKGRNADGFQGIYRTEYQRIIRSDNNIIKFMIDRKCNDSVDIRCLDFRNTDRITGNSAISRKGINGFNGAVLF